MQVQITRKGTTTIDIVSTNAFLGALCDAKPFIDSIVIMGIQYTLSSAELIASTGFNIITAGTIDFNDVNAGAVAATFVKTFAGMLQANSLIAGIYLKTNIAWASVTRDIHDGTMKNAAATILGLNNSRYDAAMFTTLSAIGYLTFRGDLQKSVVADDLSITFSFGSGVENNPKDYTAGKCTIYVEYRSFPTLS
jgi:hypothetical protein